MLCLAVMLSVMVVGAGAAFSDQDKIENTEAVDACSALNIINGYEDGAFHPERNIKRAEVTKMICVALNGGEEPNTSTNAKPTFTDVRGTIYAWAEGYIESCYAQGIVDGVNGNRFAPASNVTAAQLAKMLLVSLGYNAKTEQFTGNAWETNVNVRAAQKHLYDGLEKMDTSAPVTRDQAAQMVWNAMQAYEVEYKDGVVQDKFDSKFDRITLLRDKYEAYVNVGTLDKVDGNDLSLFMTAADKADSDLEDVKEFTKLNKDYSSLLGQKVKVIFTKKSEVLNVFATDDNTTYTLNLKDVAKDGDKVEIGDKSYSFDDGQKIKVQTVTENGTIKDASWTAADFDKFVVGEGDTKVTPATVTFVDNDGDGKLNCAYVTYYATAEVTYVGSDRIVAGNTYKMADENIAEDIKANDYVAISYNRYDNCRDIVKADVVTDTLTSSKAKTGYQQFEIGGTWYNVSDKLATEVSVGDTVKATVVAGVVIDIETNDGAAVPNNIAILVGEDSGSTLNGDQAKLRFFDGTIKPVTLSSDTKVGLVQGRAYKVSGSDKNATLKDVEENQKYNGFESLVFRTAGSDNQLGTSDDVYSTQTVTINGTSNTIGGKPVADDAVIVVYDEDGRSKIITGKQFNDLPSGTHVENTAQAAFTKDSSGLTRIRLASIEVSSGYTISDVTGTSNDNYGYIIDGGSVVAGDDVQYTIWNGSGEPIVVKEEGVTASERKVDMVIGYSSIDKDGYIQDVDDGIIDLSAKLSTGFNATSNGSDTSTAFVGSNGASEKSYVSVDNTKLNVTADTKVILVASSRSGEAMAVPYTYGTTTLTKAAKSDKMNVAFILDEAVSNGAADLELLVVDVNGEFDEWYADPSTPVVPTPGTTLKDPDLRQVLTALDAGNVTVTGEVPTGIVVPSGKVLTLDNADIPSTGVTITGDGSVKLTGKTILEGNLTVSNLDATAGLPQIMGSGTLTATKATAGNINAADLTTLMGYSNDVKVGDVTGAVTVDNSSAELEAAKITGKLTVTGANTVTVTGSVNEINVAASETATVGSVAKWDTAAVAGTLNVTGDVATAVTLPATLAGTVNFKGEVKESVTVNGASGSAIVTFSGKIADLDKIVPTQSSNAIMKLTGANVTDGAGNGTVKYLISTSGASDITGTEINFAKIASVTNGFKASTGGPNVWIAQGTEANS